AHLGCEGLGTFVALGDADLFQSCVTSLNFSTESQGAYLLALDGVANGHRQTMFIFDWQTRRLVAKTKDQPRAGPPLVSLGRRHVHFWRIFQEEDGRSRILRDKKSGLFEASPPDDVSVAEFRLGRQRHHRRLFGLPEPGPITCLRILGDGTLLSTSGSAHQSLGHAERLQLARTAGSSWPPPATACWRARCRTLLSCVVQGHSLGPGLGVANGAVSVATHPRASTRLSTCAGDRGVCK
uniref:LAM_G_DOMAIN domain-containing protein n=1 Tax=Macrostomum lignano TaxID=282301 RepID=A0A1I8FDV7_9PLAT